MRFLEQLTSLQDIDGTVQGVVDGRHQLLVEAITQNIVRVLIRKNGGLRLDRTWSIAQGEAQVPLEGLDRLNLPGDRVKGELQGDTFTVGEISCRFHRDPYYLEWSYKDHPILAERTTGAVAFGRKSHRVWHFHQLKPESRFHGLGERSGEIDRRGRSFELRNVDPMGYDARTSDPLYKHIPFYIEHHQHGYLGIFYDNLATARFNFGEEIDNYHGPFTSYRAEDGDLDFYVIACPTLIEITQSFSWLTGRTYFPPKWSLGYSTTSMTYTDVENAQERLEQFLTDSQKHKTPVKTFKYGSGYTSRDGKRYVFNWNREKFPDPKTLNQKFHQRGIRLAANIKPVLLTDHPLYEEAAAKGLFVKDSESGHQEISQFWDNRGSHLDFTNPQTYQWWQKKVAENLLDYGFDALWNDNNEYVIWDDEALCNGFGREVPISLVRPLMSLWMTRASHEIAQSRKPEERIWSISRCGCPGLQRYAQTWSGDNNTAWETLEYNNKMALGLSMSGIYNIGHDVGGFSGPDPSAEMLARWFFIGAFTPRFGVNSWKPEGSITEPWMYSEVTEAISEALGLRMQFLPQLYTLCWEAHRYFRPILRPTFMNFPVDEHCLTEDREFMWGDNLLVAPVLQPGRVEREVYLPKCDSGWWDFHSETHYQGGETVTVEAGLDTIPLFIRGGSALFLAPRGVDSIDGPEQFREVRIYPGGGDFRSVFYDDDGTTFEYKNGAFFLLDLRIRQVSSQLTLTINIEGHYQPSFGEIRFRTPDGFETDVDCLLLEDEGDNA